MSSAELPDLSDKKTILYCSFTQEVNRLVNVLSAISNTNVLVVIDKALENKLSHKKDLYTFLSATDFCRLLSTKEIPVILFNASVSETFGMTAWIKKCREVFTPDQLLIATKETKGLKHRLRSELSYALTGLDLEETGAPAICISSQKLLPVFEKNTGLPSLITELRKKPGVSFSHHHLEYKTAKPLPLFRRIADAIGSALKRNFISVFQKCSFTIPGMRSENRFRFLFNTCLLLLLFLMPVMSLDYGVTGDEVLHHEHAQLVQAYFDTGNKAALDQPKTLLHLYGQSFDLFCLKVIQLLDTEDIYETRHVLISLTGYLCILLISLTVLRLSNYRAALMALLMLCCTPVFFGHSMNNSIDIPFTLAFAGAIYYLLLQVKTYPVIRLSHCWMLICFIAFGISVRAGGMLLGAYLLLVYALIYIHKTGLKKCYWPQQLKKHRKLFITALVICTLGYFLGLRYWPYALKAPLHNPFKALTSMTFISTSLKQLFEGKRMFSDVLPGYYLSKYLLITIPLVVLTGIACYLLFLYREIRRQLLTGFFLLFSILFPILYATIMQVNIYSAWRHFLFVYPGIIILSALGWDHLLDFLKHMPLRIAGVIVFIGMLVLPLRYMYVHHIFDYIYFNELAGGLNEAWKRYETDYYAASLKQATGWLKNDTTFRNRKDTVTIATTSPAIVSYYLKDIPNIKVVYTRYYQRNDQQWDYGLFYLEHIYPFQLEHKFWPPEGTIHCVNAGEAVLGIVLKNLSDEDYLGTVAWKKGKNDESILHFKEYLKLAPTSEYALSGMSNALYNNRRYVEALSYANRALRSNPDFTYALQTKGLCFLQAGDHNGAEQVFNTMINNDRNYPDTYYYLGIVYLRAQRYEKSIYSCNYALKLDPKLREAYRIMSLAYLGLGDEVHAGEYQDIYLQWQQK